MECRHDSRKWREIIENGVTYGSKQASFQLTTESFQRTYVRKSFES